VEEEHIGYFEKKFDSDVLKERQAGLASAKKMLFKSQIYFALLILSIVAIVGSILLKSHWLWLILLAYLPYILFVNSQDIKEEAIALIEERQRRFFVECLHKSRTIEDLIRAGMFDYLNPKQNTWPNEDLYLTHKKMYLEMKEMRKLFTEPSAFENELLSERDRRIAEKREAKEEQQHS
jgi:hypothetical protein